MRKRMDRRPGNANRKPMRKAIATLICLDLAVSVAAFSVIYSVVVLSGPVLAEAAFVIGPVDHLPGLSGKTVDHLQATLSAVSSPVGAPAAQTGEQGPAPSTAPEAAAGVVQDKASEAQRVDDVAALPVVNSLVSDVVSPLPATQPKEQPLQSLLLRAQPPLGEDKLLTSDYEVPPSDESSPATVSLPPAAECETGASPLYCVYTVAQGDTLTSIAEKFKIEGNGEVSPWQLLVQSNKPDIVGQGDQLIVGQRLRIPLQTGVLHVVERQETLLDVAQQFGVTAEQIREVSANPLTDVPDDEPLTIGLELVIPSPTRFTIPLEEGAIPPAPVVPFSSPTPGPMLASGESAPPAQPGTASATPAGGAPAGQPPAAGFIWPVTGNISSYFSAGHPLGIDIDLFNNVGPPIVAVGPGTVIFAGGDPCCSYGYYVIVDHGNGIQTLYAHLSQISVSVGQAVAQGQTVGIGGRTGYATGDHLHFEVRVNGAYVDPLGYLP